MYNTPKVKWTITYGCDFNCFMCGANHGNCEKEYKETNVYKTIDLLKRSCPGWKISLMGGEPFVYPNFIDICDSLVKNGHLLDVSTNLNSSLKDLEIFTNKIPPYSIKIKASVHQYIRKEEKYILEFIDKCIYLQNKGYNLTIMYLVVPGEYDKTIKYINLFNSFNLPPLRLTVFRGKYREEKEIEAKRYPREYSEKDLSLFFRDDVEGKDLFERAFYSFEGYKCKAGFEYIFIDPYGDVYDCNKQNTLFGNIKDMDIIPLRKESLKCINKDICHVAGYHLLEEDIFIDASKEKIKEVYANIGNLLEQHGK